MPTCESCNKSVKGGQQIDHWICEDCRVSVDKGIKEETSND